MQTAIKAATSSSCVAAVKTHCHKKVIWYVETLQSSSLRWSLVSFHFLGVYMCESKFKYYFTDVSLWKGSKGSFKVSRLVEYGSTIAVGVVLKRSCQSLWSWRPPPFNQPKKGLEQNGLFYTRNFHLNPLAVALEIAHWKLESLPLLSIMMICFAPLFLNWRVKKMGFNVWYLDGKRISLTKYFCLKMRPQWNAIGMWVTSKAKSICLLLCATICHTSKSRQKSSNKNFFLPG